MDRSQTQQLVASSSLAGAWREAAELGAPMIVAQGPVGALVAVWANQALLDRVQAVPDEVEGERLTLLDDLLGSAAVVAQRLAAAGGGERPARLGAVAGGGDVIVAVRHVPDEATWVCTFTPADASELAVWNALHEAEQRFTALAQNAPVGIIASQGGVRLGFANEYACDLFGLTGAAMLGTGWLDLLAPSERGRVTEALQRALQGEEVTVRFTVPTSTTLVRWLDLRLAYTRRAHSAAGFLGVLEDVTARRAEEEAAELRAVTDALTGLASRRRLVDAAAEALASERPGDHGIAVMLVDVQGFRRVNSTLGRDVGDEVLVGLAERLRRAVRVGDVVARLEGDRFAVLLRPAGSDEECRAAARRVAEVLGPPFRTPNHRIELGAVIAWYRPTDDLEPGGRGEQMIAGAQRAMDGARPGATGPRGPGLGTLVTGGPPVVELTTAPTTVGTLITLAEEPS